MSFPRERLATRLRACAALGLARVELLAFVHDTIGPRTETAQNAVMEFLRRINEEDGITVVASLHVLELAQAYRETLRVTGKAVLLVSVELDEIRSLSDRILVMRDGRIQQVGTPR